MKLLYPAPPVRFRLRWGSPGVAAGAVDSTPVADFAAGALAVGGAAGAAGACGVISDGFGPVDGDAGAAGAGAVACECARPLAAKAAAASAARKERLGFIGGTPGERITDATSDSPPASEVPIMPATAGRPGVPAAPGEPQRRARDQLAARLCSAAMRCSIGGCVENSAMMPALSVMPEAWIDCGSAPGSSPPSRRSALTIGPGAPR